MFKKNQKGVIDPVFVIVLVLVLAVGGFVYWRTSNDNKTQDDANTQAQEPAQGLSASYLLPQNWSEIECNSADSKGVLASPDSDKAVDCDDRTSTVLIMESTVDSSSEACLTDAEVASINESKPIEDYDCEVVSVNGVDVIKSTADYGGGPSVNYEFFGDNQLSVTYYSTEEGTLPDEEAVQTLVDTVKF